MEWGKYECNNKSTLHGKERFFVVTNFNIISTRIEEYHFIQDVKTAPSNENIIFGENNKDMNFITKEIVKIMIPINKLYYDHDNKYSQLQNNINFIFCPIKFATELGYLTEIGNKNSFTKYEHATRCSLYKCDIGGYFMIGSNISNVDEIFINREVDKIYFIGFKTLPDGNYDYIYFSNPNRYTGLLNTVLVACPYKNWVTEQSLATFKPSKNIQKNFPSFPNDTNRHKLVPAFRVKKVLRGKTSVIRYTFTCGTLKQDKKLADPTPIKIGYEFEEKNIHYHNYISIKGGKLLCGGIDITNHYVFTFLNSTDLLGSSEPMIEYITSIKTIKFYSNQIIYAYNKTQILDKYNRGIEEFFDTNEDLPIFSPICVGKHKFISAKLKLKIDSTFIYPTYSTFNNSHQTIEMYTISVKSQKNRYLSCQAVLLKKNDNRYAHFFDLKYNTLIQKIKDGNGKKFNGIKKSVIYVPDNEEELAGVYKCTIYGDNVDHIPDNEFYIRPGNSDKSQMLVEKSKPNKDVYNCEILNISNQKLIEMNVTYQENTKSFKLNDKNESLNFEIKDNYVIYYPDDEIEYSSDISIKCFYLIPNDNDNISSNTNIEDNNEDNVKYGSNRKFLIITICGILTIILIIVLKITYTIMLIRYSRKTSGVKHHESSTKGVSTSSNVNTLNKKMFSRSRSKSTSYVKKKSKKSKKSCSQSSYNKSL